MLDDEFGGQEEEKLEYDIGPDLWHAGIAEPFPNVHELFNYYNSIYFEDKLGFCSVEWSSKRMTLCAGICMYRPGGGCCIRLSEPLLKFRPTKDLKETLLHEMIHAYMFLEGIRDREDHGPKFQAKMHDINNSRKPDYYRPHGGYHITVYHTMNDEVNLYRVHWWQCDRCQNVIKRAMNRPPQPADCRGRKGKGDACVDPYCSYHMHVKHCGGNYIKIKGPEMDPAAQQNKTGNKKRKAVTGINGAGSSNSPTAGTSQMVMTGISPRNKDYIGGSQHHTKPVAGIRPITDFFSKQGGESSKGKWVAGTSATDKQPSSSKPVKEEPASETLQHKQGEGVEKDVTVAGTDKQTVVNAQRDVSSSVKVKEESMDERRRRCLQAAELRNKPVKSDESLEQEISRNISRPLNNALAVSTQLNAADVDLDKNQRLVAGDGSRSVSTSGIVQDVVVIDQSPQGFTQRILKENKTKGTPNETIKKSVAPSFNIHPITAVGRDSGQAVQGADKCTISNGGVKQYEVITLDSEDEQLPKQEDKQNTQAGGDDILGQEEDLVCPVCCYTLPKNAAHEMNQHLIQCLGGDFLI